MVSLSRVYPQLDQLDLAHVSSSRSSLFLSLKYIISSPLASSLGYNLSFPIFLIEKLQIVQPRIPSAQFSFYFISSILRSLFLSLSELDNEEAPSKDHDFSVSATRLPRLNTKQN